MICAAAELAMLLAAGASAAASEPVQPGTTIPGPGSESMSSPTQVSPWSAMVLGSATGRWGSKRLNPDNAARMPRSTYDLAGVLDYQADGLSARLRIHTIARAIPQGSGPPSARTTTLALTQLNWTHNLSERWSFSLGRMNLGFDDGTSYHPLDFFEDTVRGSDFEDRAARNRGFPLVMLQRSTQSGGLRLIYSDDRSTNRDYVYGDANPNFNRGLRQLVLSLRQSQGPSTWTLVLQRTWPGRGGAGGSFSWVPGSAWSLYGAAFAARGNPFPVHRNVAERRATDLGRNDVYIESSPVGLWQANDGRWRTRGLLGLLYTYESGNTIQLELWRDGRGMNRDERRIWRQVVAFHDGLRSPDARRINLAYDLESLRTPGGTHLFARHSFVLDTGGSLQPSVLIAQDGSGSVALRWQGPRGSWGHLTLEAWRRFGSHDSSYGAVPDRTGVGMLWRLLY